MKKVVYIALDYRFNEEPDRLTWDANVLTKL